MVLILKIVESLFGEWIMEEDHSHSHSSVM